MEATVVWDPAGKFEGKMAAFSLPLAPPVPKGHKASPSPYELLLLSLAGSSAFQVLSYVKEKSRDGVQEFSVRALGTLSTGSRLSAFTKIELQFHAKVSCDPTLILNGVEQSLYVSCGIAAMLSQILNIRWTVTVNEKFIGEGIAQFNEYIKSNHERSSYEKRS